MSLVLPCSPTICSRPSRELTSPRSRSIDQLDKLEPPPLPETYLYLLSLQCFNIVVEGFASSVTPVYSSIVPLRSSLEVAKRKGGLVEQIQNAGDADTTRDMVEAGWPAILAALSFFIGRNLSDEVRPGFDLFSSSTRRIRH